MLKRKLWLYAILIILTVLNANSFVTLNDIECIFAEGPQKVIIREGMIKGSSLFLQSFSNVSLLMRTYEDSALTGIFDKDKALSLSKEILSTLGAAKESYITAKKIGENSGYITEKVNWFTSFNYDSFISNKRMNVGIADEVKKYFETADILGIYKSNIDRIEKIMGEMDGLIIEINANEVQRPRVERMWAIFQMYCETALFGNYATMLGTEVLQHCDSSNTD